MPVMIPRQSIKVIRNKEGVIPVIGQPFEFTDDEIAEVEQASPDALESPDLGAAKKLIAAMEGEPKPAEPAPKGKGKGKAGKPGDGDDDDDTSDL